jgi:hypothetical protein
MMNTINFGYVVGVLTGYFRRRKEARELEAAKLATRRELWRLQGIGVISHDINLLARDLPFMHAKTVNGSPHVLVGFSVPTVASYSREFASQN